MKKFIAIISSAVIALSVATTTVFADKWVKTDNGYVYEYDNGTTAEKGWLTVGKDKYYIQKDGTRKTGWLKSSTAKYYFGKDGKMYKSRWLTLKDGTKYYLRSNGKAATGLLTIDKVQYKFDKSGKCLGENNAFILNKETFCLHGNSNCRAAKQIDKENYAKINLGKNELGKYNNKGYWACSINGCNKKSIVNSMPKPEFIIDVVSWEVTTDRRNNNVLIVEYSFSNVSEETEEWYLNIDDTAFQNGVECDTLVFHDEVDSSDQMKKIKPGASTTLKIGYVLENTTSDVEIECYKFFDYSDDKKPLFTATFNL